MRKKLLCLVLALCAALALAVPAFAADDGYTIKRYDIQSTLHENNTITQTETITVDYHEERHGIYRTLPETVSLQQLVNGAACDMTYRVKLRNISVEGAPFETESDNDVTTIRIGDPDETVTGEHTYTISFDYDIGDDRVPDYDTLYYSFVGAEWDTTIEQLTFAMTFDKPIPQDAAAGMAVYSGDYGGTDNPYVTFTADENGIRGQSTQALPPNTGVTVHTQLPEGYFTGERTVNTVPAYAGMVLTAAAVLYAFVRMLRTKHRHPVTTVEFYPPDGITSAEVGYIIDGSADDKDLLSLILWMADKGYLTISGEKKDMVLHRTDKSLAGSTPIYLRTFCKALFPKGSRDRRIGEEDYAFAKAFQKSREDLVKSFELPERRLREPKSCAAAFWVPGLCCLLWSVTAWLAACFVESFVWLFTGMAFIPMMGLALTTVSASMRWRFSKTHTRIWFVILSAVLLGAAFLIGGGVLGFAVVPQTPCLVLLVLVLLVCLLAPCIVEETPYRVEMAGKLMGLRNFIEKAELPKLKMLVEQDPSYFYNVLPYAYVFGLTNKWAKQFEALTVRPPEWYTGGSVTDCVAFASVMTHGMHAGQSAMSAAVSSSGGSGGGGGFSGGGFSGGGFGGGGGGSW